QDRSHFRLVPLGEGEPVDLPSTELEYQWARFFPDGQRLLTLANQQGLPLRLYVQPLNGGGKPLAITPPIVVRNVALSPDGSKVALLSADNQLIIYPTTGPGPGTKVPTSAPLAPVLWTSENDLIVQHLGAYTEIPTRISRLDLATGTVRPWIQ